MEECVADVDRVCVGDLALDGADFRRLLSLVGIKSNNHHVDLSASVSAVL